MATKLRFRSIFEQNVAGQIRNRTGTLVYEKTKLTYIKKPSVYTPDFELPNKILVETKGRFTATDRVKHLLVREQHPTKDIRLVFQNPNVKLTKGSKTTYGQWATKHGIKWASQWVPDEWFDEPPSKK